ncbi:MAG TPA: sulfotransferase [Vicinamibacteria bacterium]|nr:sulfotransferase [Vicinamibacteria bacterium]
MSKPVPLVYLLAASHSGSTLLAFLLGGHPDVCTVGEIKATALGDPSRYRCSCGAEILHCAFWRRVSEEMSARGRPFDVTRAGTDIRTGATPYVHRLLKPLHRGPALELARDAALWLSPAWRRALPGIQAANATLARCLLDVTGKQVVVDSSKMGLRLKYLLRNPGFDVRVIRIIRDGRAVALAYMDPAGFADATDPRLRQGGMGGDRANERQTMPEAAHQWRRSNEEAESIVRTLPRDRWTEVRYEDVCRDTEGTLRRLYAFAGVDPDRGGAKLRSFDHHVIGNGMRLDTTTEVRMDERWRTALQPADLSAFDAEAGALNRQLGYV